MSRAITENIPLYDGSRSISDFIKELANKPCSLLLLLMRRMNQYLLQTADNYELITQKHVLNYISQTNNTGDVSASALNGERVIEIDRKTKIRDAISIMVGNVVSNRFLNVQNITCLSIKVPEGEKRKNKEGIIYPKVVTLNQISTLMLQSLMEVCFVPSPHG